MPSMSIRLPDDEFNQIQRQAQISGLPTSTYCREVLQGHEVKDNLHRQEIAECLCKTHNRVDDAQDLAEAKQIMHGLEERLWRLIR